MTTAATPPRRKRSAEATWIGEIADRLPPDEAKALLLIAFRLYEAMVHDRERARAPPPPPTS